VGEGHPDKLCDQVADAVLDECLKLDPLAVAGLNAVTKDKIVRILAYNDVIDINHG
jgi:S-adenosylmethionine synthetase